MKTLEEIFEDGRTDSDIVSDLKISSVTVPKWDKLIKIYDPHEHEIVNDHNSRRDVTRSDGKTDIAARIPIAMESLVVDRLSEYMFTSPVNRKYTLMSTADLSSQESDIFSDIQSALESIYESAYIDEINLERAKSYFASCENVTFWYAKKRPNDDYGFHSDYKIYCKSISPIDGYEIYPIMDDDDLLALSFAYTQKEGNVEVNFFETFTDDKHYVWRNDTAGWTLAEDPDEIELKKMPLSFMYRKAPVYVNCHQFTKNLEYKHSEDSDTVSYNSSPVLVSIGHLENKPNKGESQRYMQLTGQGADVKYVSWQQSVDAVKHNEDFDLKMFFMISRIPDLSFGNLASLGSIGYDAMQTLLTDINLKAGGESFAFIKAFKREFNIVKEFLKYILPDDLKKSWTPLIDKTVCKHSITRYSFKSDTQKLNDAMTGNGGQPVYSQKQSIQMLGGDLDAQGTIDDINKESTERAKTNVVNAFNPVVKKNEE